jgi:hypothetical protein
MEQEQSISKVIGDTQLKTQSKRHVERGLGCGTGTDYKEEVLVGATHIFIHFRAVTHISAKSWKYNGSYPY